MRKRKSYTMTDVVVRVTQAEYEKRLGWSRRRRLPDPLRGGDRGVPILDPGGSVGGAIPGTAPSLERAIQTAVSPYRRREAIIGELQRLAGYDVNGDPLPRKRSKREVAATIREIRRNLDEAVVGSDQWVNLMLSYTGRHPDPKAPRGHPGLPDDLNEKLKTELLWRWLGETLDLMTPSELRPIRDGLIEDAIRQYPELSARKLAVQLDNIISHDTINRIKKRLEREEQMSTAAVTEIKQAIRLEGEKTREELGKLIVGTVIAREGHPVEAAEQILEED